MRRLLRILGLAAVAVAVLVWPARALLQHQAVRVQMITANFAREDVDVNQAILAADYPEGGAPEEEIIAVYGTALGDPEEVLFADESQLVRPALRPDLLLLRKEADQNPLTMQTVDFLAPRISIAAAAAGVLALLLSALFGRPSARQKGRA